MSATYQPGANAVRTDADFIVDILEELESLKRKPAKDGTYPDLPALAFAVELPGNLTNLALDALIGRTPRQAAADLFERGLVPAFLPDLYGCAAG